MPQKRGFGFAIVGCGMIANFHARAIADLRGASLVACYSRSPEAVDRFAAEHQCRGYHELAEMLADPAVDIVTICTPSGAHLEPAVAAARAGKHVIVEKPLEITLARCDAMIDACRKNGVMLATIFPSRFHRSSIELKRAVDAGRFGRLTLADAYVKWYRTQAYYDSGAWRGTWELDGGGALMNQAIHSVDLLTWLAGPGRGNSRPNRHAGPRADRGRRHGRGHAAIRKRSAGRHRSHDGRLAGLAQADRAARLDRQRRHGRGGRDRLGLRQTGPLRRRRPQADGAAHQHGRRGGQSGRHRPSWPRPAIQGFPGRDPARTARRRSTAPKGAGRSKSSWASTNRPKPAGRCSCRLRETQCSGAEKAEG